ncbi:hypothetical protein [Frankia sp. AgB32]|uniref:hypothetical protein n=1 Tax=Frankia sp. AgB32 TaxID=631119 RepID=UPI00200C44E1|nr:hypothetical protein [Frankia sp. AgB32]MCK9894697.1 hypothetical protein [Frankia sp. AgB32]
MREPREPRAGLREPRGDGPPRRARRAVYRSRYWLAPAYCAAGLTLVAWGLRGTLPTWAALFALIPMWVSADLRIARGARTLRAHRAGILLAFAGMLWAGWVVVAGLTLTAAVVLAVATLVCWPWWAWSHRVRRSRAAGKFARAWPWAARERGLRAELTSTVPGDVDGQWSHDVALNGDTVDQLRGELAHLEARLKLRRNCLRVDEVLADASRAVLHVVETDPLVSAADVAPEDDEGIPWPGPDPDAGPDDPITVGLYEDVGPIELTLDQHILLVGGTGAGKGTLLKILIGEATARRRMQVRGIDFKGGRLLTAWGRCIARVATNAAGYDEGIVAARAQLRETLAEVDRRSAAGQGDRHAATEAAPHILQVVDEAERVLADPECYQLLIELSDIARSERVTLAIAVKRTTNSELGSGRLLTNIGCRVLLGSRDNPEDLRRALPKAVHFPVEVLDRPGKAAVYRQGQTAMRPGRVFNPTDEQIAALRAEYEPAEEPTPAPAADGTPAPAVALDPASPAPAMPTGSPSPEYALALLRAAGPAGMSRTELMACGWDASATLYDHLGVLREADDDHEIRIVSVRRRWYAVEHAPADP